jgi:hypothetical protein
MTTLNKIRNNQYNMKQGNQPKGFFQTKMASIISGLVALGIVILVIFLVGNTNSDAHATVLYNPLITPMEVQLDGETYQLMPGQSKKISIKAGTYQVVAKVDGKALTTAPINITAKDKERGCLINLSGEPMYLWREKYGRRGIDRVMGSFAPWDSTMKTRLDSLQQTEAVKIVNRMQLIVIDSVIIMGNIKEYPASQRVITREWYYGTEQAFEESISANSDELIKGKTVAKIFSKRGALQYWKEEYGELFAGEEESKADKKK